MTERERAVEPSWQKWVLGIVAGAILLGIASMAKSLNELQENSAVMKRDLQYLTLQATQAESFREKVTSEVQDLRLEIQRLKQDHTGTKQ